MKKSMHDTFRLNNGLEIPCIGYGTYKTPQDEVEEAVLAALREGYRHVDTAAFYANERGVGAAVRCSGLAREDVFLTSKLWNTDRGYGPAKATFAKTLEELGTDYVDLYLIHWPANRKQFGDEAKRINAETWRALEELYAEGKAKAIGLSNFLPHHIGDLLETASVTPMVNQIEFHPGWPQLETVAWCQEKSIVVEAWSPLGRATIFDNDVLKTIAAKYGKTIAQVCVRWALQHNVLPLPKSLNPARMRENTEVFDFEIDAADMEKIDALKNIGGSQSLPDEITF